MPRRARRAVPSWVWDVLNTYSPGQLQAGVDVSTPTKVKRQVEIPGKKRQWQWDIVLQDKRVSGSRIPASIFTRMRHRPDGEGWMPGPKTIVKLKKFRERVNYRRLRAAGASVEEASLKHKRLDVDRYIDLYRRTAVSIARGKQVPVEYILFGLMESPKTSDYWEAYTKRRITPEKKGKPEEPWPVQDFPYPKVGEYVEDEEWEDELMSEEWADFYDE